MILVGFAARTKKKTIFAFSQSYKKNLEKGIYPDFEPRKSYKKETKRKPCAKHNL